jgi:hypothetical protein
VLHECVCPARFAHQSRPVAILGSPSASILCIRGGVVHLIGRLFSSRPNKGNHPRHSSDTKSSLCGTNSTPLAFPTIKCECASAIAQVHPSRLGTSGTCLNRAHRRHSRLPAARLFVKSSSAARLLTEMVSPIRKRAKGKLQSWGYECKCRACKCRCMHGAVWHTAYERLNRKKAA